MGQAAFPPPGGGAHRGPTKDSFHFTFDAILCINKFDIILYRPHEHVLRFWIKHRIFPDGARAPASCGDGIERSQTVGGTMGIISNLNHVSFSMIKAVEISYLAGDLETATTPDENWDRVERGNEAEGKPGRRSEMRSHSNVFNIFGCGNRTMIINYSAPSKTAISATNSFCAFRLRRALPDLTSGPFAGFSHIIAAREFIINPERVHGNCFRHLLHTLNRLHAAHTRAHVLSSATPNRPARTQAGARETSKEEKRALDHFRIMGMSKRAANDRIHNVN